MVVNVLKLYNFLRYKALETTFYVVIALLPSLAVYEMVRHEHTTKMSHPGTSLLIISSLLTKKSLSCLKETQCRVRKPVCAALKLFSQFAPGGKLGNWEIGGKLGNFTAQKHLLKLMRQTKC